MIRLTSATGQNTTLYCPAKRQINATPSSRRVLAVFERVDAVIGEARWSAPDNDVAVMEHDALRLGYLAACTARRRSGIHLARTL